jgi:hypothetical protein
MSLLSTTLSTSGTVLAGAGVDDGPPDETGAAKDK